VAPIATKSSGTRVQTWLPISLAEQLKAQADLERRSVSAVIRLAVEDQLRRDGRRP
jgi:Ribbon-helix-helix protein, copG family